MSRKIRIKYFGPLTDITRIQEEGFEFNGESLKDLLESLYSKYPALRAKTFQVAQDQAIIRVNEPVTGNEIALLPPFSGG